MLSSNISPTNYPSIQRWEEAGTTLATALTTYLDLSLSLGTTATAGGAPPSKYLVARIDSVLESLHTVLDRQIAQARSALAHTRNRLISPICCLPNEILFEVFVNVVFTPLDPGPENMQQTVAELYQALHGLIAVCSVWRDVVLARGVFWSIIPIIDSLALHSRCKQATGLSLERARGDYLHLAADLTMPYVIPQVSSLAEHAPRFRTINISTKHEFTIREILNVFRDSQSSKPLALSELSVRQIHEESYYNKLPAYDECIFPHHGYQEEPFNDILQHLTLLRISGAQFQWDRLIFTHQLTELHLEQVVLGRDPAISGFIGALASATGIRDLRIVSVITFFNYRTSHDARIKRIYLPNLQSLLVQDLYFKTLDWLLASIASRSHRLTLLLNAKCKSLKQLGVVAPEDVDMEELYTLLRRAPVNTLLLNGACDEDWFSDEELGCFLKSMPTLETIRMHCWDFFHSSCRALRRPRKAQPTSHEPTFPSLKNIHLSRATIGDREAFKKMIASHSKSIQRVVLGGVVYGQDTSVRKNTDLQEDEPLMTWLKENVPGFELADYEDVLPEFEESIWQLW